MASMLAAGTAGRLPAAACRQPASSPRPHPCCRGWGSGVMEIGCPRPPERRGWNSVEIAAHRFAIFSLLEQHLLVTGSHLLGLIEHFLGIAEHIARLRFEGFCG